MICPRNTAKNLSDKFSSKHFSLWYQKKYLYYTISWRPRTTFLKHFESKCLFLYISLKKNCFRDVVRFVLVVEGERWDGGRLNKFLKAVHCSGLAKCFTIFVLIGIFENLTIFSISIHLFIALKRWNFPDNLDFKSKTEATFLIRSHFISI